MNGFHVVECEQRSPEWFAARAGRVTASAVAAVFATIKSGEAAARRDYRMQLAIERLTGRPLEENGFVSKDMQRGIDLEPAARARYEAASGNLVRVTGFVAHDSLLIGASLDGDIDGFTGLVEIKCPKSTTHVGYLKARVLPEEHRHQAIHQLWLTGAKWHDFVSYDDRLPERLQYFTVRTIRDEAAIARHAEGVTRFLAEVAVQVQELQELVA